MHVYPVNGIAKELRFQWQTFEQMPSEATPRFFTPYDDEDEPINAFFDTPEQAEDWRNEFLSSYSDPEHVPDYLKNWVLVEVKLRAVKWYKDT